MSAVGLRRIYLAAIGPNMSNCLIVGIIIARQEPRTISSKKNPDSDRGVFSFTLRDSPADFINASFWGATEYVSVLGRSFHVGDVVEIHNPRITFRQPGDIDEKFRPSVTSPFQLTLSETHSHLQRYEGNPSQYIPLMNIPTKPPADFLTLADVHTNGATMRGECVDLLVAIRSVGPIRQVKTKTGKEMECRDIVVLDQTSAGLPLQIWDQDTIHQADMWQPRETILFIADARVEWSSFRRGMVASIGSRTVICQDPDTPEALALQSYARTAPIQATALLDHLANSIPDANNIRTVMTVRQVLDKAWSNSQENYMNGEESQFTALLYCFVSHLDLDGCSRVTLSRCSRCQIPVDENLGGVCVNLECPVGSGTEIAAPEVMFDLRVTLSDHTGSVSSCRLVGSTAERVLRCTVAQFLGMSSEIKTALKWKFLLERCAARVLVLRCSSDRPRPLVSLLACDPADPAEVATHCPVN